VRVGNHIAVGGTAPIAPDGSTTAPGDPAAQAERCLEVIAAALREVGADIRHVIRTRAMLTDITHWRQVAEVHGRYFALVRPASTIVQVSTFIDAAWLVEFEADAVVDD
jgi:enamine deaminase RidA (YjgF/YER057c/UK114 family)